MWKVKSFEELTVSELFEIYKLRVSVFVVEQESPYQDVDEKDKICLHGLYMNEQGELAAYFRLIPEADGVHLGRVVVNPRHRKGGLGRELVATALTICQQRFSGLTVHSSASLLRTFLCVIWICFDFASVFGRWHSAY